MRSSSSGADGARCDRGGAVLTSSERADAPRVVAFPPLLYAGTLAAGVVAHVVYPVRPLPATFSRGLGAAVLLASLLLARQAKEAMRRAGTNIDPRRPAVALVMDGPFRFSRNPLYIATAGLYAGISLLIDALWPLILLVPLLVVIDRGVIAREETYLEEKFQQTYRDYKTRVRRWV